MNKKQVHVDTQVYDYQTEIIRFNGKMHGAPMSSVDTEVVMDWLRSLNSKRLVFDTISTRRWAEEINEDDTADAVCSY